MSNDLSWEEIVAAVNAHGNSALAQDAIDNDAVMPDGEVGVVTVGDDEFVIHIGTDCGEIQLAENYVMYEDGAEHLFDDEEYRETTAMDVLPEYITKHL